MVWRWGEHPAQYLAPGGDLTDRRGPADAPGRPEWSTTSAQGPAVRRTAAGPAGTGPYGLRAGCTARGNTQLAGPGTVARATGGSLARPPGGFVQA
ncbi:hypothetical protein GCM10011583_46020 [Streptomyces camponoticapitis]|uniref:Uncharacterized protein n=1 Tax=Streptomyces camponoticapitis TaxID=1616125 RepID=A0ABQ2EEZ0_9ACTN|nr:hypothetical protein GCM10011583_46020 [Streptomyces camponoticapitis]